MLTSRPFSTISYNSGQFITVKLNDLINRRFIAFYGWIEHYPEDDESKKHKHLYVVPNGRINTDEFVKLMQEFDPTHPDKPLGCIVPKNSKFFDWYLYALHDPDYLASKGQSRKYHYQPEEVVCSDPDYLAEEVHQMDMSKFRHIKVLRSCVEQGVPFDQMVVNGVVPIPQIIQYRTAYDILSYSYNQTNRNGRESHQVYLYDPETGEIDPTSVITKKV